MSNTTVDSTYSTAAATTTGSATANEAEGVTRRDQVAPSPAPSDIPVKQDDFGKNNTDDSSSTARQGHMGNSNHSTTKGKVSSNDDDDDDPAAKKIGKPNYDGQVPLAYEKASSCSSSAKTRVDVGAAAAAAAAAAATPASQDKDDKQKPAKLHFLSPKSHIGPHQCTVPTDHDMKTATDQANHHDDKKQPANKLHFFNPNHPPAGASHRGTLFGGLQARYTSEEEQQEVQAIPSTSNTDVNEQNEYQQEQCHNDQEFIQLQHLRQAAIIMEEGLHQPGAFPDGPTGFNTDLQFALVQDTASNAPPPSFAAVEQQSQGSLNVNITNDSPSLRHKYSGLAVAKPINDDDDNNPAISALPMAEEFDPIQEKSGSIKRRQNLWIVLGMGSLTALVVTVAVTLGVTLSSPTANSSSILPTSAGPAMAPSPPPTQSLQEYILSLLPQYALDAIDTEESPQSKALEWLMEDPLLESHPDWRIIQKFALATFFYATGGEVSWINNDHWLNHSIHECLWFSRDTFADYEVYFDDSVIDIVSLIGIDVLIGQMNIPKRFNPCEEENPSQNTSKGTFKHIWLWANQLQGTLPPELYLLTSLKSISLYSNKKLEGTISSLVGELNSLQEVLISATGLSGTVPTQIGLLHKVTFMNLFSNQLSGSIPSELGQMSNLFILLMDENKFMTSIPTELGLLGNLFFLSLAHNALTGSIPTELGQLTNLGALFLFENALAGSIPQHLVRLRALMELLLFSNQLTSSIPTELGLLVNIKVLHLDSNQLTSSIPTELGLLTDLQDLELYVNQLTSTIPTELGLLTKMSLLYLFENSLVGIIPTELGLLTKLTELLLDSNQIKSSIPTELVLMTDLEDLQLYDLQLLSSIPTEIGLLTNLTNIVLMNNALTGIIPSELGLLTNLENLLLSSNQLTSMLPTEIGKLTSLWVLQIFDNYLSGSIPTEVGLLANSTLPTDYGANCTCLGLTLNDNLFEGKIPSEIGQISDLPLLLLQGNQLTGEIPREIFALALKGSLQTLNVTRNQLLSGIIPEDVCLVGGFDFGFDCTPKLCGCDCAC